MCRWLAYSGAPVLMKEVLYGGTHSLVDQSLHSRLGAETTNGDGFGVGWYGAPDTPGVFHSIEPAWNDRTCESSPATSARRCSSPTSARRSAAPCSRPTATRSVTTAGCSCTTATSTSSPRSNATSYSPSTRRCTRRSKGQADTEVLFYLALTFGLEDDPPAAVEQAIGLVEAVASRHGVPIRSRARSRPPTARASGRSGTPASANRARSSTPPTCPCCASYYPERQLLQEFSDDAG